MVVQRSPPPHTHTHSYAEVFSAIDFNKLAPHVDGFSLMTYDYARPGTPGPNSPVEWMEECVVAIAPELGPLRQKILLGLNFYGYDHGPRSMDGELTLFDIIIIIIYIHSSLVWFGCSFKCPL